MTDKQVIAGDFTISLAKFEKSIYVNNGQTGIKITEEGIKALMPYLTQFSKFGTITERKEIKVVK